MNTSALGWGLAVAAVATGYVAYGWPGVALALTVVVFWLLLQFSRALRVMQRAAARPVGSVANAVMLQARLTAGMRLPDVLGLTGSLGLRVGTDPEIFAWQDASGDCVRVELQAGRVSTWQLQRAADTPAAAAPGGPGGQDGHPTA